MSNAPTVNVKLGLWLMLVVGYLTASLTGAKSIAMVLVALMIGVLLAMSGRLITGVITGAIAIALCLHFADSATFMLYVPPVAAFAFMTFFFGRTLRSGAVPLITLVARKEYPELPQEIVRYTRLLTVLWTVCFASLSALALGLSFLLPTEAWSRWVQFFACVVPAALFLGEYWYRHYRFAEREHASLPVLIRNSVVVIKELGLSSGNDAAGQQR